MASDPMVDYSIAAVRKIGKWRGPIYIITDHVSCFEQAINELKITTIFIESLPSIIEIKALKPKLFRYLPSEIKGILYIDVDVLVTQNLAPFIKELSQIAYKRRIIDK